MNNKEWEASYKVFKQAVKTELCYNVKHTSESEINSAMNKNEYFISECFRLGFSPYHVYHELTTGEL